MLEVTDNEIQAEFGFFIVRQTVDHVAGKFRLPEVFVISSTCLSQDGFRAVEEDLFQAKSFMRELTAHYKSQDRAGYDFQKWFVRISQTYKAITDRGMD